MNELMLLGLLVLNFAISFWNAYASGAYMTESKIIGGWARVLTWSGLVMSACGFTWVYLCLLAMLAVAAKWLTPEWGEIMFKLGYLVIILPVLGSGMAIWIDSLVKAYRRRTFGSVAVAGWNTFAQAKNTWDAAKHAPSFLSDVLKAFSGKGSKGGRKDKDSAGALLVILLVVLALAGGILTTMGIARWADRRVSSRIG